ncbi:MAG: hypothetical protein K940chlam9_00719 [Chlamydiae bacterium]|nr:hypothetical protein [Chlamydiota bacterium]
MSKMSNYANQESLEQTIAEARSSSAQHEQSIRTYRLQSRGSERLAA